MIKLAEAAYLNACTFNSFEKLASNAARRKVTKLLMEKAAPLYRNNKGTSSKFLKEYARTHEVPLYSTSSGNFSVLPIKETFIPEVENKKRIIKELLRPADRTNFGKTVMLRQNAPYKSNKYFRGRNAVANMSTSIQNRDEAKGLVHKLRGQAAYLEDFENNIDKSWSGAYPLDKIRESLNTIHIKR